MSPATLRDIDASKLSYVEDQNGQRVPCLATQEFYKTVEPYERTFHIKASLWLQLITPEKGSPEDGTAQYQFDPGQLAFALWPFDITRIVFREPIWEKTSPHAAERIESRAGVPQNIYRRQEATFVRRLAHDANGNRVQVVSLYSQLQVKGDDDKLLMITNADGGQTDYGVMRQAMMVRADGAGASDVWTYGAKSGFGDDHCTTDPSGALGGLPTVARFAAFCDMLTYDRHLVTVRKLERDKRKKISWHSMAVGQAASSRRPSSRSRRKRRTRRRSLRIRRTSTAPVAPVVIPALLPCTNTFHLIDDTVGENDHGAVINHTESPLSLWARYDQGACTGCGSISHASDACPFGSEVR